MNVGMFEETSREQEAVAEYAALVYGTVECFRTRTRQMGDILHVRTDGGLLSVRSNGSLLHPVAGFRYHELLAEGVLT